MPKIPNISFGPKKMAKSDIPPGYYLFEIADYPDLRPAKTSESYPFLIVKFNMVDVEGAPQYSSVFSLSPKSRWVLARLLEVAFPNENWKDGVSFDDFDTDDLQGTRCIAEIYQDTYTKKQEDGTEEIIPTTNLRNTEFWPEGTKKVLNYTAFEKAPKEEGQSEYDDEPF